MANKKPQLVLGRPKDRSLEAFKTWIEGMAKKLAPDAPDDVTEEDIKEYHRQFWEKIDKAE